MHIGLFFVDVVVAVVVVVVVVFTRTNAPLHESRGRGLVPERKALTPDALSTSSEHACSRHVIGL